MAIPERQLPVPEVVPLEPVPAPEIAPKRPRRRRWLVAALVIAASVAALYRVVAPRLGPARPATAALQIPTAPVQRGTVEKTIRLTGVTKAGRYVSLTVPHMWGSRSRMGLTVGGSTGVQSTVTVSSTSSVAPTTTLSALSQTGTVASTSAAQSGGGGLSGAPRAASSRMSAVTSRVGGGSAGGSRIQVSSGTRSSAMGSSGVGSTSGALVGGGGGGGAPRGGGGGFGGGPRGEFSTILHKLVPAGTMVKAGDVVAEFDRQFMLRRVDDYEAAVAQHEANLRKTEAEIEVSRKAHELTLEGSRADLEKAKLDMQAIPVLSQMQAERLRLALEQAEARYKQLLAEVPFRRASEEAQLRLARLDLEEAKVELERARNNAEKLIIRAPMDGMVVLLDVFRGGEFGRVREGDAVFPGQPFAQIIDPQSMIVQATVNQVDVEQIRIGMKARVYFDAFPGLVLPARVYSIGTVARASQFRGQYLTTVPVVLKLEKVDPRVIPDLSVAVEVVLQQEENATFVPLESIFYEAGNQPVVYVQKGELWERRPVSVGLRNHVVAVVRSGLRPGELVARRRPPQEKIAQ